MNRVFFLLLVFMLIPSITLAGKSSKGQSGAMSVQVREAVVKSSPNYLSASAGILTYGTQVSVIKDEGNWYQIDNPSGWVPKSSLTTHKVALNPDQKFSKGTSANRDEVALAGKGFNPQVEAKYKSDNPSLSSAFADVDQVERFGANDVELKAFKTTGRLQSR